ncbi:LSU ribosomal protein L6p (L9e) [Methylophaga frappieri]|jgi:large subunit ribosomal protein L6|uniref:Large ribosomal subunit protein uL6 n=1 Tax=Methylophaga frappieri (strain ATCC BAA-2434 / DSM 25690 / JAM7) TaxID=754477 RepID=I1YKU9_METFJ|nr:50S ribosomal protein L6 [Methylophaga frappieri]AFJ03542.1 LSU ribosomal protein L6p (L9e) [Methylophaga frappieri]
MSRIANAPVEIPAGVEISLKDNEITVKGSKGTLSRELHPEVEVAQEGSSLTTKARNNSKQAVALTGTARALINNMVHGVSQGFEKRLTLVGVGYRAKAQGNKLDLTLGFSHPVQYDVPAGVSIDTPSQTEIVVTGADKQVVGQVAADIRAFRAPEPYKGKGVRYNDEYVARKEAKKK